MKFHLGNETALLTVLSAVFRAAEIQGSADEWKITVSTFVRLKEKPSVRGRGNAI